MISERTLFTQKKGYTQILREVVQGPNHTDTSTGASLGSAHRFTASTRTSFSRKQHHDIWLSHGTNITNLVQYWGSLNREKTGTGPSKPTAPSVVRT